ncbi:monomethylamine:corrinoid methyltransferase [Denitratisoma oestradiolicum]|uniref:Methylamine---corrinoid protein Co-methyltransferase n=1 Tax=Denitratisoma oestradiolicum TaxID=311182 RepID=A0A6S6XU67_9PROT|nr:monomethylamine:corrinoid methyltransferase [Denitratisoma oestradiolicum]TWO79006.1 hypothetical protein CBW56_16915 [Denitratisoma oestradiolicum]CAB1368335.1 Methylamine---corrinoid protein Co-methyltransferase [Denitratisoma oestradiolicum]
MIPTIDFQRRCNAGPVTAVDDFDLELAFKVRELVAEYDIKYTPNQLIVDDRTADAIFEAGLDLLSSVGLHHQQTGRVVQYNREELVQIAAESKANPACVTLGKGTDKMSLRYRKGSDTWAPTNYGGPSGVADPEWFIPYVQSFAQESHVKGIGICPGIPRLGEIDPKAGTLSEVAISLWEQEALREALKRAGRLDMNLGLLCTASTAGGTMSVMSAGYRDARNTQIGIHIMPEQKLGWNPLLLAQYCEINGIEPWQSSMSCIGGLCRDGAEVAVTMIANAVGQMSYGKGSTMSIFASHLSGAYATRESNWAVGAASRASEQNMGLAIGTTLSGTEPAWRTPLALLQAAGQAVVYVASGLSYAWISGHTGLEARLIGEMMDVLAGYPADKANELGLRILARVEEEAAKLPETRKQRPFPEVYDLDTVKPKQDYETGCLRMRDELHKLGMPYR